MQGIGRHGLNQCRQDDSHHTTFPEPVSPAMRRCGVFASTISYTILFPNWSRPTTIGRRYSFNNGCHCL